MLLAVAAVLLTACDPVPPNDGRDLGASLLGAAPDLRIGDQVSFDVVVTNHGTATATSAVVAVVPPDHVTVDAIAGAGVSDCQLGPDAGYCGLGDLAVGSDRVVTVTLTGTAAAVGDLQVGIRSDAAEPVPDLHRGLLHVPITVRPTQSWNPRIEFDPTPPAPAGIEFDVSGVAIIPDGSAIVGYFTSVSVPSHLEVVSVTLGGTTLACTPTGSCTWVPYAGVANGSPVSIRLRALSPAPSATVSLNVSTYGFGVFGSTTVQVVDPAVTSQVHPELLSVADGTVGVPQSVRGRVRNTGSLAHPSVTATVEVPPSVHLVAARTGHEQTACTIDGPTATCELGGLPAYSEVPLELVVRPVAPGPATVTVEVASTTPQDTPDPFPDTATATFDVAGLFVDLGITPSVSHTPAVEAAPWVLSPTVTNHGTSAATGTRLVATVPDGVAITSYAIRDPQPPDAAGCSRAGQQVTCEVGTLHPGATARVDVRSDVVVGDTGTAQITVGADQPEPAPDPHTNVVSHTLTVDPARADLWSFVNYGPNVVVEGVPVTLRAMIASAGPSTVTSSEIEVTVPADWTITAAAWDDDGTPTPCTISGTTVTCATGPLTAASGNSRDVEVTAVPGAPATGLTFSAAVSSPLPDPDPSNDLRSRTIDVVANTADVGLTAAYATEVGFGVSTTIDLTVRNDGPAAAEDTVVTATVPEGTVIDSIDATGTGFTCGTTGQVLTCTHPSLGVGHETLGIHVRHLQLGPVSFTATVSTTASEGVDALANSVTITRQVAPQPATLTGTVVREDGTPAAGVPVWVHLPGDPWPVVSGLTGADGTYAITGLTSSEGYQVQFWTAAGSGLVGEWYDDVPTRTGAATFTPHGLGEAFVADAELAPTAHTVVHGTVTAGSGSSGAGYTTVTAYRPGAFLPFATTTADHAGNYVLQLSPGEYQLRFEAPASRNLRVEWYDDQAHRSNATIVVATGSGQVVRADARLAPKEPPTIRGTVLDEADQPVAGATVAAYRPGAFLPTHTALTGADGSYSLPVTDGGYEVRFVPPSGAGLAVEWFDDQVHRSGAVTLVADAMDQVLRADAVLAAVAP